ncbi:hypothetical protein BX600DRAFT_468810 [Xylariales sp. PMI_506]|nr:hypothetical protein BX600DRAFT_468810 [Xylariales sp. PMI_506]
MPAGHFVGPSLVVGGCGFLGYHLVGQLLRDGGCGPVYVVDRNIDNNRHSDATYTQGNLSDVELFRALIVRLKPQVIFHIASPPASLPVYRNREFYETNVKGTDFLLTLAAECDAVQAFVYCSSVDVYADPPHYNVDETHALWQPGANTNEYNRTKTIADRAVLAANDGVRIRTAVLRPGHMYGERHTQGLYQVLDSIKGNTPLVQVGNGDNLMEAASGENVALAHILAAKALLNPQRSAGSLSGRVDGEAFNISDGNPVPFWHHIRVIWKVARGEDAVKNKVTILPAWLMLVVVTLFEWGFWILTIGTVAPPRALTYSSLSYCVSTHTYSIQKARERLGFVPIANHDEVLAHSVRWELNKRNEMKTA